MKFYPGVGFERGRIRYRVVKGGLRDIGDMILEFSLDGSAWFQPPIEHTLICAECKFQVEENNYPRPRYKGGYYLLDAIKEACKDGWEPVSARIKLQRNNKNV